MDRSSLKVEPNLMLYDDKAYREAYRYMPGDLVGSLFPYMVWRDLIDRYLTPKQKEEFLHSLTCTRCHRPCAGTCES